MTSLTPDETGMEVLRVAFRHRIAEPNAEAGFECFRHLSGSTLSAAGFHDTVARCVASRLIHDPVRLTEGALHCHWRLELTAKGVSAAREDMRAAASVMIAEGISPLPSPSAPGPGEEEPPPVFWHGTSVRSGLALLNGGPLSARIAAANKIDGPPGFYLATDPAAAEFFAARRAPGTILRYTMTRSAVDRLLAGGSALEPIPQGNFPAPFPGAQLVVPPVRFPRFNALRGTGAITVSP